MRIAEIVLVVLALGSASGLASGTTPATLASPTALASPAALASPSVAPKLSVSRAWVRANVPGTEVAAAYFNLRNPGPQVATLIGISTASAASASVHATVIARGVSSMRELEQVKLLPGETVEFEPGGMHVMLMGVKGALRPGTAIELKLRFADGTVLRVVAPILPINGSLADR